MSTAKQKKDAKSKASSSSSSSALSKIQPAQRAIIPFELPPLSDFEQDVENALVATQNTHTAFSETNENIDGYHEHIESSEYRENVASASVKKPMGTFSVCAIISQVNSFEKWDGINKRNGTAYMVTARLNWQAISQADASTHGITIQQDIYGSPYFSVPVNCNLGSKKLREYISAKSQLDTEKAAMDMLQKTQASDANKGNAKPQQQTKRPRSDTAEDIAETPLAKKLKISQPLKPIGPATSASKSSSIQKVPVVEEPPDSQVSDDALVLTNSSMIQHQGDGKNGNGNRLHQQQLVLVNIIAKVSPIGVTEHGTRIFAEEDIHGQEYLGEEIIIQKKLPIDKDVTFVAEEKFLKVPPTAWTMVKMDVKGNPYVSDNTYTASGWSICGISDSKDIPRMDIYKLFELMSQRTAVQCYIHSFTEAVKKESRKYAGDPEYKKGCTMDRDTLMWMVVGNEMNASRPLKETTENQVNVFYKLNRVRTPESFKKEDPFKKKDNTNSTDNLMGVLPYKFDCYQWIGDYHSKTNETHMKFCMDIKLGWKHVCPSILTGSKRAGKAPSLRINSITAWQYLMCANYPHIKMVLNVKENVTSTADLQLNKTRYGQGLAAGDVNLINKPYSEQVRRFADYTFKKDLFIQQAILLPLLTIKSCCIPVTQDYIVNTVWGGRRSPPESSSGQTVLDKVPLLPVDLNDEVHCLSESKNIESFFSDNLSGVNERYNFYAMTNVAFNDTEDKNGQPQDDSARLWFGRRPRVPQEGVVYLEAIRNVVSSGGLTEGCFSVSKSIKPGELGGGSMEEKYKKFLDMNEVPANSVTRLINPTQLHIFHEQSKLVLYFYAVSKLIDDPPGKPGENLKRFKEPIDGDIIQFLEGSKNENEEEAEQKDGDENNEGLYGMVNSGDNISNTQTTGPPPPQDDNDQKQLNESSEKVQKRRGDVSDNDEDKLMSEGEEQARGSIEKDGDDSDDEDGEIQASQMVSADD